MYSNSNKRLAKNTLFLYFRTLITLLITLYSSRIVLNTLGIEDYGIYNVVGSVVIFFSFLSGSLVTAIQRFLTIELGHNDISEQKRVFNLSLTTCVLLAILISLLAETIGIWFLNNKLNISNDRLDAAKWTYHLSILTFCINIIRAPYNATIIAHERMSFYAYMSIFEAFLKLMIVFALQLEFGDKLILYAGLLVLSTALVNVSYWIFIKSKFKIYNYNIFLWDKTLFYRLLSFSGWSMLGNGSNVLTQNGLVFLINIFWGVSVNAALGISNQVNVAMVNFVSAFQTSFSPQIIKSFAKNETDNLVMLIKKTSKFSFMLIFIPSLIVGLNIPLLLKIWLNTVPEYAIDFCYWIIAGVIIDATTAPFNTAIMATGNIKRYQIAISVSFTSDILISYLLIRLGITPSWLFVSRICTRGITNMFIGLFFLKSEFGFNVNNYYKEILFPILLSILIIAPIPFLIVRISSGWYQLFFSAVAIILIGGYVYYKILLTENEREYLFSVLKNKFVMLKF